MTRRKARGFAAEKWNKGLDAKGLRKNRRCVRKYNMVSFSLSRQGQPTDSTFIVLSGRLRSVITHKNGRKEVVAEYGKGDLVGIVSDLFVTLLFNVCGSFGKIMAPTHTQSFQLHIS